MRREAAFDLHNRLGLLGGKDSSRVQGIRERIKLGDPINLSRNTLFVATKNGDAVGSVIVSTHPPGFWKQSFWREPKARGLGVFHLVVFPDFQRQGIGRFLMTCVELLAAERGIPYVRLDAFEANPESNGFYRAIGYDERITIDLRGCGLVMYEKGAL